MQNISKQLTWILNNTKRQRYAINLDIFFITKPSNIFGLLNLSEQWFKHLSDIKTSYFVYPGRFGCFSLLKCLPSWVCVVLVKIGTNFKLLQVLEVNFVFTRITLPDAYREIGRNLDITILYSWFNDVIYVVCFVTARAFVWNEKVISIYIILQ